MSYWARIGVRLIGLGLVCVSYWARIGVCVIGLGLVCVLLG